MNGNECAKDDGSSFCFSSQPDGLKNASRAPQDVGVNKPTRAVSGAMMLLNESSFSQTGIGFSVS
jgi:hypothetical protein